MKSLFLITKIPQSIWFCSLVHLSYLLWLFLFVAFLLPPCFRLPLPTTEIISSHPNIWFLPPNFTPVQQPNTDVGLMISNYQSRHACASQLVTDWRKIWIKCLYLYHVFHHVYFKEISFTFYYRVSSIYHHCVDKF